MNAMILLLVIGLLTNGNWMLTIPAMIIAAVTSLLYFIIYKEQYDIAMII